MKLLIVIFLFLSFQLYSQKVVIRTPKGSIGSSQTISMKNDNKPSESGYRTPFLNADVVYSEPSGNGYLDAGEEGNLHIKLKNIGHMTAEKCNVQLIADEYNPQLTIVNPPIIDKIIPDEEKELDIKIKAGLGITTSQFKLTLKVTEKRGFDLDPEKILLIPTRVFMPPHLEVVDFGIEDDNRNMKIERREFVDITFRIQNTGENPAYEAKASVKLGEDVIPIELNPSYLLDTINPGEYKDFKITITTNSKTTKVKITVQLSEKNSQNFIEKIIELPFDIVQKTPDEIKINTTHSVAVIAPNVSTLKLDIAENIPYSSKLRENDIAVIIGNKNYQYTVAVDYAINDAALMRNYVVQALGFKEENVIYITDCRQSDFRKIFGNENNFEGQLYSFARKGQSELFIYYSGHGVPDLTSGQGYLVPVDCDPNMVALNGYSLQTLYENLGKIAIAKQLKQITIVLDACFSGQSQNGNLINNISSVKIKPKNILPQSSFENVTIFTSASGDQVSNWYPAKKQSLFTYFFLKGLQGAADLNKDKEISAQELYQFVADEVNGVPYWSGRLYPGRVQTPMFTGKDIILFK